MKIHTKNQLKDELDRELAWRKVELTNILWNVSSAEGRTLKTALRTSILLLYAHWEGFVKNAGELYLNFVSNQNLKLDQLSYNFLAIALRQKVKNFIEVSNSNTQTQFVKYFSNNLSDLARINYSNVIQSRANLNSDVLKEILNTIGIDYSLFELKENLIDAQLLKYRNTIAHGDFLMLDQKEYVKIHSEIFSMINEIKNRIENATFQEDYIK